MPSIVYLSETEDSPMVHALVLAGFKVHEAYTVISAMFMVRYENIDAVVIAPGFDDPELPDLRRKIITLQLTEATECGDLIWELSALFSKNVPLVQ